jgi:CobQ-like glutamine amidotransferase family enzyme
MSRQINIAHLYAAEMNIYGDNGNILVLQKRLEWRGYQVKVQNIGVGDKIPHNVDIIFGGGGQDAGQSKIADDLNSRKKQLLSMRDSGVVMLMICGMYQLFGHYFQTANNEKIPGIGILDVHTIAGDKRIIGNIITKTEWGSAVGYENHSGRTFLGESVNQLGVAKPGQGNNGEDGTEGAVQNNVFGSYLHGPMLSKSPNFADELIFRALNNIGVNNELQPLDDFITTQAIKIAKKRPR